MEFPVSSCQCPVGRVSLGPGNWELDAPSLGFKRSTLEVELEPQLNLTGDRRRRDRPERARRPVAVCRAKVRLVQQVECLHPCFEAGLIATKPEVLVQPEIELVERI